MDKPGDAERLTTRVECAEYFPVRDAALLAHATQIDPAGRWFAIPMEVQQAAWPSEDYQRARSLVDTPLPEDDLFAGVREHLARTDVQHDPDLIGGAMNALLSTLPAADPVDPDRVGAGTLGFIVFAFLAVATVLILWFMTRSIRKVPRTSTCPPTPSARRRCRARPPPTRPTARTRDQSARGVDQPVPVAARGQPGRLVPVGRRRPSPRPARRDVPVLLSRRATPRATGAT